MLNFTVPGPSPIFRIMTSTDATCADTCDGTGAITIFSGGTPPFTYLWSTGVASDTDSIVTNLCVGTWYVTTTDFNGCQKVDSVIINEPPPIVAIMDSVLITCGGGCDEQRDEPDRMARILPPECRQGRLFGSCGERTAATTRSVAPARGPRLATAPATTSSRPSSPLKRGLRGLGLRRAHLARSIADVSELRRRSPSSCARPACRRRAPACTPRRTRTHRPRSA